MENITIGEFIKEKRKEKGITLHTIEKMGFNKSTWSKIENNFRKDPEHKILKQIAQILEINYIELYKIVGYIDDEAINEYVWNKAINISVQK